MASHNASSASKSRHHGEFVKCCQASTCYLYWEDGVWRLVRGLDWCMYGDHYPASLPPILLCGAIISVLSAPSSWKSIEVSKSSHLLRESHARLKIHDGYPPNPTTLPSIPSSGSYLTGHPSANLSSPVHLSLSHSHPVSACSAVCRNAAPSLLESRRSTSVDLGLRSIFRSGRYQKQREGTAVVAVAGAGQGSVEGADYRRGV